MLDHNTILEIINSTLPVLASSPVLIKLFGTIENVIKTLYMPTLTLKNGKAEVDVEIYRKKNEAILLNQTFTLYEITKLKNFVKAANFAAAELQNYRERSTNDNNLDFDWIMRFFDAVSNVSNEEMQKLWGKVLAGEVKQPGNCSLRTMDIIRNMSQNEADTFDKLCKYVLISGDCYFIFHRGFSGLDGTNNDSHNYISKTGLNYSDNIIPMVECGLLSIDNTLATDFKTNNTLTINNQKVICFIISEKCADDYILIEPYFLTRSGIELYNIIQNTPEFNPNIEYSIICFRELKRLNPSLIFSAHKIIGTDEFDSSDLL